MFLRKIIGIDFGTVKSRIIDAEKGIIFELPTVIAIEKPTKKIVAVGTDAEEMIGKTPIDIDIIRPVKNSVLSNYRASESLLRYLINKSIGKLSFVKPIVVLAVPSVITSVEKRALEEAALSAGAGDVYLFPSSYLAALGSGLEIDKPLGNMIVNIGGGTTESAVLSFNGIVVSNSTKYASLSINEAIVNYFKKMYGLVIGEAMSDRIKTGIASAIPMEKQMEIEVRGRDATTGMPKAVLVKTNDLVEAIKPVLSQIIISIRSVLEKTPPELSSDIVDTGIMLSGGGALLNEFSTLLIKAMGIPVVMPDNPDQATALGLHKIISDFDRYGYKGKS
jgi:rod shape-determining protein MreB and related proteins